MDSSFRSLAAAMEASFVKQIQGLDYLKLVDDTSLTNAYDSFRAAQDWASLLDAGAQLRKLCRQALQKACTRSNGNYHLSVLNAHGCLTAEDLRGHGRGNTPLQTAVKHKRPYVVAALFEMGLTAEDVLRDECAALVALKPGDESSADIMEEFFHCGVTLDDVRATQANCTFYKACEWNNVALLRVLFRHGMCADDIRRHDYDSLVIACEKGHHLVVRFLLQHLTEDDLLKNNCRAFLTACRHNRVSVVRQFLKGPHRLTQRKLSHNDVCVWTEARVRPNSMLGRTLVRYGFNLPTDARD